MLSRRVIDVAGTVSPVQVSLNGKDVNVHSFKDFVGLFADEGGSKRKKAKNTPTAGLTQEQEHAQAQEQEQEQALVFADENPRWQVGVRCSSGRFTQVSFVNNMATHRGGTHVAYIANQIIKHVQQHINKKRPELEVTANAVRPHVALFIKAQIANPGFDAQVKDFLTSKPDSYGSSCDLSPAFLKAVVGKTGIVEKVVAAADRRQRADLRKQTKGTPNKQNINIPKLEDAVYAGERSRTTPLPPAENLREDADGLRRHPPFYRSVTCRHAAACCALIYADACLTDDAIALEGRRQTV